jgi:hypothetical protein
MDEVSEMRGDGSKYVPGLALKRPGAGGCAELGGGGETRW